MSSPADSAVTMVRPIQGQDHANASVNTLDFRNVHAPAVGITHATEHFCMTPTAGMVNDVSMHSLA
jgi:hypothetical protein